MSKRENEAEYFERFKSARPDLDLTAARHEDAPDFIVSRRGSILGVEVTRFAPPAPSGFIAEEQDVLRDRLLARLRDRYYALNGAPLHVQAVFNDRHPLRARRIDAIVSEIASILLDRAPFVAPRQPVPWERWDLQQDVPEIVSLSAVRVLTRGHGTWYAGKSAWVRLAEREDFELAVRGKEPRLPAYRTRADEVWLLIAFEMLPGGTYLQLPPKPTFALDTGFDRIFALEVVTGDCIEVPTSGHQPVIPDETPHPTEGTPSG